MTTDFGCVYFLHRWGLLRDPFVPQRTICRTDETALMLRWLSQSDKRWSLIACSFVSTGFCHRPPLRVSGHIIPIIQYCDRSVTPYPLLGGAVLLCSKRHRQGFFAWEIIISAWRATSPQSLRQTSINLSFVLIRQQHHSLIPRWNVLSTVFSNSRCPGHTQRKIPAS